MTPEQFNTICGMLCILIVICGLGLFFCVLGLREIRWDMKDNGIFKERKPKDLETRITILETVLKYKGIMPNIYGNTEEK